MKTLNIVRVVTALLFSVWFLMAYGQGFVKGSTISADQTTNLKLIEKKINVSVQINAKRMMVEDVAIPPRPEYMALIVTKISITVDGENVFVPRSVFADLVDANKANLEAFEKGWKLTIVGGDASDTYTTVVFFNNKQVTHLEHFSGLEKDLMYRTKYRSLITIP